jgi:hypothetical protein
MLFTSAGCTYKKLYETVNKSSMVSDWVKKALRDLNDQPVHQALGDLKLIKAILEKKMLERGDTADYC